MEALASMESFLRGRPTHFNSVEHAIEWCVRSGPIRNVGSAKVSMHRQILNVRSGPIRNVGSAKVSMHRQILNVRSWPIRNVGSAKVSMPRQILNCDTGELATREAESYQKDRQKTEDRALAPTMYQPPADRNDEEGESSPEPPGHFTPPVAMRYKWRIGLSRVRQQRHWAGWFRWLSAAFLAARAPKLLLLASIDGLDRELMVGQMQGKFQMQGLTRWGHAVHVDTPADVARTVAGFVLRHRLNEPTEGGELMHLGGTPGRYA